MVFLTTIAIVLPGIPKLRSLLVEEGNDGCPADEWSEILIIIALHVYGVLGHAHTCREDLRRR